MPSKLLVPARQIGRLMIWAWWVTWCGCMIGRCAAHELKLLQVAMMHCSTCMQHVCWRLNATSATHGPVSSAS